MRLSHHCASTYYFLLFNLGILISLLSPLHSPDIQQNQFLDLDRAFLALLYYCANANMQISY